MTSRRATQRDNILWQTQRDAILEALEAGRILDVPTAQGEFGCFRLAARIGELRRAGHIILTLGKRGKNKFGRYVLLDGGGAA